MPDSLGRFLELSLEAPEGTTIRVWEGQPPAAPLVYEGPLPLPEGLTRRGRSYTWRAETPDGAWMADGGLTR